jgi:hypothetical protein
VHEEAPVFIGENAQSLVVVILVAAALLVFWRVVLAIIGIALVSLLIAGGLQIAHWIQALS